MLAKQRIDATATLRQKKSKGFPRAEVPSLFRRTLAGCRGDRLVFEERRNAAVMARSSVNFVIRLERGTTTFVRPEPAASVTILTLPHMPNTATPLKPLEEMVSKRLNANQVHSQSPTSR